MQYCISSLDILNAILHTKVDVAQNKRPTDIRRQSESVGPLLLVAGKLYRDQAGDIRFAFGKHKDKRVVDALDYCRWMIEKGKFPGSTMDVIREVVHRGQP